MGRTVGPERAHFGGADGLITKQRAGKTTYSWACDFCGFEIGGRVFPNRKARIHLSGDTSLRDGTISQLCRAAPEEIKQQFTAIEKGKREAKEKQVESKKRAAELMAASPEFVESSRGGKSKRARKQTTLNFPAAGLLKSNEVDDAWAKCFFVLDIAPNKIESPFFKSALEATKKCPRK